MDHRGADADRVLVGPDGSALVVVEFQVDAEGTGWRRELAPRPLFVDDDDRLLGFAVNLVDLPGTELEASSGCLDQGAHVGPGILGQILHELCLQVQPGRGQRHPRPGEVQQGGPGAQHGLQRVYRVHLHPDPDLRPTHAAVAVNLEGPGQGVHEDVTAFPRGDLDRRSQDQDDALVLDAIHDTDLGRLEPTLTAELEPTSPVPAPDLAGSRKDLYLRAPEDQNAPLVDHRRLDPELVDGDVQCATGGLDARRVGLAVPFELQHVPPARDLDVHL
ncbi:hypothetical protein [Methanopyrus kandleri]